MSLSISCSNLPLAEAKKHYKHINRPNWTNYFLGMAVFAAERSEDYETQHGCVLTNNNRIIATGCNGFAKGVEPEELPNIRPFKYPFVIHSEQNSIDNSTVDLRSIPGGAICYITAKPCLSCLYRLWNNNISTIYYIKSDYYFQGWEGETEYFDDFVRRRGMLVYEIEPNLNWMNRPIERIKKFI